ncbi:MAG: outer membrane protein assembly factor BamD [Acidobacteria bacterium]|nr:outer membrane protein assembly factor BamD [Acidobacteriota bacterium]
MRFRSFVVAVTCAAVVGGAAPAGSLARAGQSQQKSAGGEGSPSERVSVMRSKLDGLRHSLSAALASFNAAGDDKAQKKSADDAAARLRGLDREASQLLGEVVDIGNKIDRQDKFEPSQIGKLETAVSDLSDRAEKALQETAGERRVASAAASSSSSGSTTRKKKGGGFLGIHLFGGGGGDEEKYADLINGVKPGRDRELFEEAARLARKDNYEGARLLFETIINTYPDSPYLPHAKLAIADTFYLEGSTSSLIQAGNAYQEWLTFFPTDPLSDEVMLKAAEVEMRQMGLPDRDVLHARKAEQRLKALMQQFPNTSLKPDVQVRLNEVQENLGMHTFQIGNFYWDRYVRGVAPNPKGAQSRYRETVEKYPNFSRTDKALYFLAQTYLAEEQPDEAAKYLQRILREFPESEFRDKATEQLDSIGAAKPDADKNAAKHATPPDRGMMRRFLDQVVGTVPATVDKNGVLIGKDKDTPQLIDVIIENKGTLPATTPSAVSTPRRTGAAPRPAAPPTQQPAPAATKPPETKPPSND